MASLMREPPSKCDKCEQPFDGPHVHILHKDEGGNLLGEYYWCQSCAQARFSMLAKEAALEA